ncbi:gamma-glutamyltransferase family protein [Achromobacter xylosoxidans]|uniref:gamma-glutamyltransferase family protein n=1 Tax=Alcaligenes xylosoxydans xylosoxydans TaxID=85698 RepID=UPI0006BF7AC7|nr:gamma-glutamyltransferase family protein [Achromobacter xylosoxidans]CUI88126.1 Gamma-glutamyltranspeptidase precursor [Achromobacter xylosoxidans]
MRMPVRRTARFLATLALCGAAGAQAETIATGMVAAANPLAAAAGLDALKRGGSVVDAAIAVQMVLTVVEPQSSGLGGGTLMLVWDQDSGTLSALDGLAAAPARTTASLRTDVDGATLPLKDVARLGRPVGVPGTVRVMALAHQRHGKLPWASLFQAGIHSAEDGFPMSPYLHDSLQRLPQLAENPAIRNVFYDARGQVLPVGATVRNPLLADALRKVAADPDAINHGVLTADVLAAIGAGKYPSLIQAADLAAYRPVERTPICGPFLSWKVCTFPPPSFGGVSVLQQLGMLAAHRIDTLAPGSAAADHLLIDTARIAHADRLAYIGDPAQVKAPVRQLIAPGYVRERAALLSGKAVTGPRPGAFAGVPAPAGADAPGTTETSQVAIVDARGNALSMTTTINLNFGSWLMPHGFFLNNALTNFSSAHGKGAPNAMAPNKRPVTSMAPTMVFDGDGTLALVTGSAGGGYIVDYIAQAVVGILAWGLRPADALALPHVAGNSGRSQVEKGRVATDTIARLAARGHKLEQVDMKSGAAAIRVTPQGLDGAADPRRDGAALGH